MASNAENVSIWWRHHDMSCFASCNCHVSYWDHTIYTTLSYLIVSYLITDLFDSTVWNILYSIAMHKFVYNEGDLTILKLYVDRYRVAKLYGKFHFEMYIDEYKLIKWVQIIFHNKCLWIIHTVPWNNSWTLHLRKENRYYYIRS